MRTLRTYGDLLYEVTCIGCSESEYYADMDDEERASIDWTNKEPSKDYLQELFDEQVYLRNELRRDLDAFRRWGVPAPDFLKDAESEVQGRIDEIYWMI